MVVQFFRDDKDASLPDAHPINSLSRLRKLAILITICFSGFLANYSIAAIQVAFVPIGKEFGVSPGLIPTSIGYNLLGIAVGPLFWNTLAKSVGRRPTYLIGSALFIPCVVWMALSKTFPLFCVARTIAGLVSSFSQTVPPSTVADIFVRQVRGSKMSAFGVSVIIAPVIAPFICGFVVQKHTWPVCFWIVLGFAVLQFALFFFLVPETLWVLNNSKVPQEAVLKIKTNPGQEALVDEQNSSSADLEKEPATLLTVDTNGQQEEAPPTTRIITSLQAQFQEEGHVGMAWKPWQEPGRFIKSVFAPILMIRYITLTLTSIYYGMLFAWSVGITIVMPIKFAQPPYNFSNIALGCAFLAFGIGSLLGKWSGGIVSDKIMIYFERKNNKVQPEYRLHALPILTPFMLVGCILVGVTIDKELHWIVYLVGGAIFFYCISASTGILQTYVLESYMTRSSDTQAVFVFFKSIWGFAIAYFVVNWGQEDGFLVSYGVQGALSAGLGLIIWACFTLKGANIRTAQGMPLA